MEDLEDDRLIRQPKEKFDITTYKIPKVPQSVWNDEDKKWVVDSPEAFVTKILSNPKMEQHKQDIFRLLERSPDKIDMTDKIIGSKQKDLFRDIDKDKVPNVFDYNPKDKNIKGPFDRNFKSLLKKKTNFNKKIKDLI